MRNNVDKLKRDNPEFEHHILDASEQREFIKANFEADVLLAYDTLIPAAFKADLWRYCILYKKGGIYVDIKFRMVEGSHFIELTDREYFVLEKPLYLNSEFYPHPNISREAEFAMINDPNYYDKVKHALPKSWPPGN